MTHCFANQQTPTIRDNGYIKSNMQPGNTQPVNQANLTSYKCGEKGCLDRECPLTGTSANTQINPFHLLTLNS